MSKPVSELLSSALTAVVPALDIAAERPRGADPPQFCTSRGYTEFLGALSQDELVRCESEGLGARLSVLKDVPPSLAELARHLTEVTRLPGKVHQDKPTRIENNRSVSRRKQSEIEALLDVVAPLAARAERVVDVGAGRGHFTRIAAEVFEREAVGIERVPERVTTAERLAAGTRARFVLLDATRETLGLREQDLAIGLHACGALGDRLILDAGDARCAVVLVSCCLQKIPPPARIPLSSIAARAGFVLSKETLGLSNLVARQQGVETSLAETMDARRKRWSLVRLLEHRGLAVELGQEMHGLNRRCAHRPFAELVAQALSRRGLSAATPDELAEHERHGAIEFERMRRFSLPRAMLARALEVTVALDRAASLEERGYDVRVVEICAADVTPRNLAIIASLTNPLPA